MFIFTTETKFVEEDNKYFAITQDCFDTKTGIFYGATIKRKKLESGETRLTFGVIVALNGKQYHYGNEKSAIDFWEQLTELAFQENEGHYQRNDIHKKMKDFIEMWDKETWDKQLENEESGNA